MRTLANLYDNSVPLSLWNVPNHPRFQVGDKVIVVNGLSLDGVMGSIASVLPARPTSSVRTGEHHYFVNLPKKGRILFGEKEIDQI